MGKRVGKESFGKRLRMIRKLRKITQYELANLVHSTQGAISAYERGYRGYYRPDLRLVMRIAKVLDVNVTWLLFGN
jgi:transcriptional regulator with XRE-family HTH domain